MSTQNQPPRGPDGKFLKTETVGPDGNVTFYMTEFESRVIGNRLERAANRCEGLLEDLDCPISLRQDCQYWSNKFDAACRTRKECDDECYNNGKKRHVNGEERYVQVKMSDYECWSLGNRLFEIGTWFDKKGYSRVAHETQWLARRFHAEKKEQMGE